MARKSFLTKAFLFRALPAALWQHGSNLILLCDRVTVDAAVLPSLPVRKAENMGELLLRGGDAAGISAAKNIPELLRELQARFPDLLPILDVVHRDAGIDIS